MIKSTKMPIVTFALMLVVLLLVTDGARGKENEVDNPLLQTDIFLPILTKNYQAISEPTVFGIQMYGNTGSSSPYHPFLLDSESSWLRVPISWYLIEPEPLNPPVYHWNSADTFTQAAKSSQGGLSMIVTVTGNPDWAAEHRNGPIDPEYISSYTAFMAAAVERYDGDGYMDAQGSPTVKYWEIYNEPDRGSQGLDIRWGYDGDKYAQLLAAVYPVIKNANPDAEVVMGGLAYDWFEDDGGPFVREFLDDVLTADGGDYFDIMNYHVYPIFWYNWTYPQSPGLIEKTDFIMTKLASYGYTDKGVLITEAGWHSNDPNLPGGPDASDPEAQARYVVELFTQSAAVDALTMVWWMLHDPVGNYAYKNGLITNVENIPPLEPKPSYLAFKTAVAEIGSADFHRILPLSETGASEIEAFEFRDSLLKRTVYVAWLDPVDTLDVKSLRIPASMAFVRDIYDNAFTVTDGQDGQIDGRITVNVKGQPVYIEVDW
jgi:hypothetical protein